MVRPVMAIAENPNYPECKTDIWNVRLLPTLYPKGYRVGIASGRVFLLQRDHTLVQGEFAIIDRRNYSDCDFDEKLKQLLAVM